MTIVERRTESMRVRTSEPEPSSIDLDPLKHAIDLFSPSDIASSELLIDILIKGGLPQEDISHQLGVDEHTMGRAQADVSDVFQEEEIKILQWLQDTQSHTPPSPQVLSGRSTPAKVAARDQKVAILRNRPDYPLQNQQIADLLGLAIHDVKNSVARLLERDVVNRRNAPVRIQTATQRNLLLVEDVIKTLGLRGSQVIAVHTGLSTTQVKWYLKRLREQGRIPRFREPTYTLPETPAPLVRLCTEIDMVLISVGTTLRQRRDLIPFVAWLLVNDNQKAGQVCRATPERVERSVERVCANPNLEQLGDAALDRIASGNAFTIPSAKELVTLFASGWNEQDISRVYPTSARNAIGMARNAYLREVGLTPPTRDIDPNIKKRIITYYVKVCRLLKLGRNPEEIAIETKSDLKRVQRYLANIWQDEEIVRTRNKFPNETYKKTAERLGITKKQVHHGIARHNSASGLI